MGGGDVDSVLLRRRLVLLLVLTLCAVLCAPAAAASGATATAWVNHGGGLDNWRYARDERKLSPETAHRLAVRWEYVAGGDVSATPAIHEGVLYFPSFNGLLHAVDQRTGTALWSSNLTESTGLVVPTPVQLATGDGRPLYSRATPVVHLDALLVSVAGPAAVAAFDRRTGRLLWTRVLDAHPLAVVTQGGTAYKGFLYIGVSSREEAAAASPEYPCCSFIGSLNKVDIRTGKVVWTTRTLPDNGGQSDLYAGAAVWGSSPAIDRRRRLVYIATGNTYRAPAAILACAANATLRGNGTTSPDPCVEPGNLSNGVLAISLRSGAIKWGRNLGGLDAWTVACYFGGPGSPNCPPAPGPDYDFGQAPMLLTIPSNVSNHHGHHKHKHSYRDVAVVAQKSGIVWALDRDTGAQVWAAVSGPGGLGGGAMWGSATDGASRVFVTNANSLHKKFTLVPSGEVITGGGAWAGLDAASGELLWTTAAPNDTGVSGPVTLANGVVLGSSDNLAGDVYALDAKTGHILWHSDVPVGTVQGGFSVSEGCAFFGAGYASSGLLPGTSLYAFCVT